MSRISSIQIKNPRVIELVSHEEEFHGAGRNTAEAAENLILSEIERRKIERSRRPLVAAGTEPAADKDEPTPTMRSEP